ncbi:hypothetical protein [Streptomyces sp. NPDC056410]
MTTVAVEWRHRVEQELGILSVPDHLGPDAVRRCGGPAPVR